MNKAKQRLTILLLSLEKLPEGLMRRIPILVFTLAFFFTNCKKDKTKTPQDYRVKVGNQTFGAYLNGQPWVSDYKDVVNGIGPIDVAILRGGGISGIPYYYYLWVSAKKSNEEITLYLPSPLTIGRKLLQYNTQPYPAELYPQPYGMYEKYAPFNRFISNNNTIGFIDIINVDTIRKDIEATFEFEAINTQTNEKIKVTNGYFKK